MGGLNSGRRPKPTALKIIEGNRGHRAVNVAEIRPRDVLPPQPDWLCPQAKDEWARVVPELARIPGLLTVVDMQVLAGYCQSYGRWQQYEKTIDVMGSIYETTFVDPTGAEQKVYKANPVVLQAHKEKEAMRRFAAELGFSPSARGRINVPPVPTRGDDDLDDVAR